MSYNPHTWQSGETITADQLNALEQAAAEASSPPVASVNNQTGAVSLAAADVGADVAGAASAAVASLPAVARSGAYADLFGKPTLYTDANAVAAVQGATSLSPTGAWNFTQNPTVGGVPIGGGGTVTSTEADFVVAISGGTVTATPRSGSGLSTHTGTDAYTVIQACITDLTPSGGGIGSAGGIIHLRRGTYNLSNELTIVGWEGTSTAQQSQLIICGDGHNTVLHQVTSGKNGLVVSNGACFGLRDLRFDNSSAAKSCLRLDRGGATTETSCNRSFISNVQFDSNSTTDPAGYFQNFFELSVPAARFANPNNSGLILENSSTSTNFGNSYFGLLSTYASTTSPNAGLIIRSTTTTHPMNLLTFGYLYCTSGYYGVYTFGAQGCAFQMVDIEYILKPLYFDGGTTAPDTRHISVLSGYLMPATGGTGITATVSTGGNNVRLYIETNGDSTVVPLSDASQFRPVNSYDLTYPTPSAAVSVTNKATRLLTRAMDGSAYVDASSGGFVIIGSSSSPISSASTARPATSGVVYWMMANGVTPTNAAAGDIIWNHA